MTYLKQKFSIALNGNLGPKDILHMDILPNILPSEGFNIILTAIDVFSRKLFAYPTNRITSPAVASVIRDILCKHSCLPTAIITDMGTQFNSQVTREEAAVLGVELKHTSTKHAQTIGMLERTHAKVKTQLTRRERLKSALYLRLKKALSF